MTRDRYRKGGPEDDVARNIRNQQMQDAAPSAEEAAAMSRRALAERGCDGCGIDDPEQLQRVGVLVPSCPRMQAPREPFKILCDDCLEERPDSFREKRLEHFEQSDRDVAAIYGCDRVEVIEADIPTMTLEGEERPMPYSIPSVELQTRCACGAVLDDVIVSEEAE